MGDIVNNSTASQSELWSVWVYKAPYEEIRPASQICPHWVKSTIAELTLSGRMGDPTERATRYLAIFPRIIKEFQYSQVSIKPSHVDMGKMITRMRRNDRHGQYPGPRQMCCSGSASGASGGIQALGPISRAMHAGKIPNCEKA
jgi:hypothetical protein